MTNELKTERKSLLIAPSLKERSENEAKELGMSFNAFINHALFIYLEFFKKRGEK